MADYWIKLYTETLDDPKLATLPDRLWRRSIELFLLAGRLSNRTGKLPDTRQLAWMLRMPTDDLQMDLDQLTPTGIIEPIPNGWLVVNFKKRQAAATGTERSRQSRERAHRFDNSATNPQRFVAQIKDIDSDIDTELEREGDSAGAPPPHPITDTSDIEHLTPRQAEAYPEIRIFLRATGRMPGRPTYRTVIETINQHGFTVSDLQPYWRAWNERGYNPANLAWLTEWAVSGKIPENGKPKSNGKAEKQSVGSAIEEAKRRLQNEN